MPGRIHLFRLIVCLFVFTIATSLRLSNKSDAASSSGRSITGGKVDASIADALNGAWLLKDASGEQVLIFIDNYFTHTAYTSKKFISTAGGKYSTAGDQLKVQYEFSTTDKDLVGTEKSYSWSIRDNKLTTEINGSRLVFTRVDDGSGELAGNWQITGRMQGDKMNEMKPGARKTIKILSGSRFQWAAINTETKEFSGTGGGDYTFKNGKYTENIAFFSRDSSRVGASLSFDGSIENGKWIHKGLSSRGEKIHEVWSRGR